MRKLLFLAAMGLLVSLSSCKKENEITITFEKPTNEETVSNPADVHIHIEVEGTQEIEVVKVKLENESDGTMVSPLNPFEKHVHAKTYHFEQDLDLSSYPAGTEFHLEVEVCADEDCTEIAKESAIHFSI